jgi:pimeloyl-ACP methyl ester carboxylesterase
VRVDEHTIEVAGSPVFYRRAEAAGIPALYLHGVPTSSDDFVALLEHSGGIAPDLIGFGRSAKGGNLDFSLDGQADFLERLLEVLAIERVRLVAHDWGAAAGLVFAQRHPERVQRIVLFNAPPLIAPQRLPRLGRLWQRPVLGELAMGLVNRRLLARWLRRGAVSEAAWPDQRVDAVWEQFDQGTQRAILRLHRSGDEQRRAAIGAGLPALEAQALVLWGDEDPWLAPEIGAAYAERLPQAALEPVAGAGHWPWLDRPEVVERVAGFLASG